MLLTISVNITKCRSDEGDSFVRTDVDNSVLAFPFNVDHQVAANHFVPYTREAATGFIRGAAACHVQICCGRLRRHGQGHRTVGGHLLTKLGRSERSQLHTILRREGLHLSDLDLATASGCLTVRALSDSLAGSAPRPIEGTRCARRSAVLCVDDQRRKQVACADPLAVPIVCDIGVLVVLTELGPVPVIEQLLISVGLDLTDLVAAPVLEYVCHITLYPARYFIYGLNIWQIFGRYLV